jgi:sugar phosphate isomerase/epimerase
MAKIGLQLYTVKNEAQHDFLGLLKKVADIGYDGVEFAGYFDTPAKQLLQVLQDLQLEVAGTHIGVDALRDHLDDVMAYSQAIHCPTVICPIFRGVDLKAESTFRQMGKFFNQVGETCRKNGLRFMYHIHGHEFETFNGQYGLDILLEETAPENMALQPDTAWVEHAGLDAVAALKKYGSRCASLHLRDIRSRDGRDGTEVGNGIIDMPGVLAEAQALSIEWLVVEQEKFSMPPLESVAINLKNIRAMLAQ